MKTRKRTGVLAGVVFLFIATGLHAQNQEVIYVRMAEQAKRKQLDNKKDKDMKTYLIEREIPNAGQLSKDELQDISKKSNTVLAEMGPGIEWLHSYVTDNKVYCVYKAENEALIREHAEKGGFPVNGISELSTKINPETGKD